MPIYEFRCRHCGTISEYLLGPEQGETITCRHCGSPGVVRILSAATVLRSEWKPTRGHTCCGREERCETAPCSTQAGCLRK
ncbi:MAG: zinc ribbon domain-containing protein [Thermodesulfobacteriota bacterium]